MLRTSAGPSRGALLQKSTFFASVTDFFSILPPPRPPRSALGLSLGSLGGSLAAPGVPLGLPKGALAPPWRPFWGAFRAFRRPYFFLSLKPHSRPHTNGSRGGSAARRPSDALGWPATKGRLPRWLRCGFGWLSSLSLIFSIL